MALPITLPKPEDTVVVLIDAQERLWTAMHESLKPAVLKHTQALLKACTIFGVPVICTEQYPKGLGPTLPDLRSLLDSEPIAKTAFSCCDVEDFSKRLESLNRGTVAVAGMESHVCVYQTVVGLLQKGYRTQVLKDAVCSRKIRDYESSLDLMKADGASISTVETLVFSWTRQSGTEAFKKISGLVRDLA